jgi:hemerythrin-like domain-containing protein
MKRSPELTDLSRDHHAALVIARRAERAAEGDDAALREAWLGLRAAFAAELEPHFAVEERTLLPALAAAGEEARVARTLADHTRLRALAAGDATRDALRELGALLHRHVRYEEKDLFPCAERVLSTAALAAVAEASAALATAVERVRRRPI